MDIRLEGFKAFRAVDDIDSPRKDGIDVSGKCDQTAPANIQKVVELI